MTKLYGNLPVDLGIVGENINCDEMMFYLYLPIKVPGMYTEHVSDKRLEKFQPILDAVFRDNNRSSEDLNKWVDKYVYLTVKTLYVAPGCTGQRSGWHSDGFMTNDINYIWYTDMPTVFYSTSHKHKIPQTHEESLEYMKHFEHFKTNHHRYPNRHLLRLDETVVHKTDNTSGFTGIRTFVKISVSDHVYAHKGNSINPDLPLGVEYVDRNIERNCPLTHRGVHVYF